MAAMSDRDEILIRSAQGCCEAASKLLDLTKTEPDDLCQNDFKEIADLLALALFIALQHMTFPIDDKYIPLRAALREYRP